MLLIIKNFFGLLSRHSIAPLPPKAPVAPQILPPHQKSSYIPAKKKPVANGSKKQKVVSQAPALAVSQKKPGPVQSVHWGVKIFASTFLFTGAVLPRGCSVVSGEGGSHPTESNIRANKSNFPIPSKIKEEEPRLAKLPEPSAVKVVAPEPIKDWGVLVQSEISLANVKASVWALSSEDVKQLNMLSANKIPFSGKDQKVWIGGSNYFPTPDRVIRVSVVMEAKKQETTLWIAMEPQRVFDKLERARKESENLITTGIEQFAETIKSKQSNPLLLNGVNVVNAYYFDANRDGIGDFLFVASTGEGYLLRSSSYNTGQGIISDINFVSPN